MKNKEASIKLVDSLLKIGTKILKEQYGGYNPYYLKKWVNDRLHEKGYNKIITK